MLKTFAILLWALGFQAQPLVTGDSLTISSNANPSTYGQTVTFTAHLTPITCYGEITFLDGANEIGSGTLSAGYATMQTSSLSVGSHLMKAQYAGTECRRFLGAWRRR